MIIVELPRYRILKFSKVPLIPVIYPMILSDDLSTDNLPFIGVYYVILHCGAMMRLHSIGKDPGRVGNYQSSLPTAG